MIKVLHVPGGLLFLVGFGLLLPISTTSSVCNLTFIGAKDSVLTLSNDQVKADTAERECVKLGGHLAATKDQQINDSLTTEINRKFDLRRVYMFYNPTDVRFYKYSKDPTETGVWKSTKNNPKETLWFIDLYRTWATGRERVNFCTTQGRHKWFVTFEQTGNYCGPNNNGWLYDFHLYGSSSATGSQQIYSYRSFDSGSHSSRLTTVQGNYYNNFDKQERSFFSSVSVKVLIGARYNNSRWLWSDGTPANFAAPTTSPSTCLQKAYNPTLNTWEDVQCTQTAYYACQVKFSAIIEHPKCNSNYLIVKWNDNLSKLAAATGNNINTVSLNVHSKEMSVSINVPYKTSVAELNGLKAQTSYLTTAQVKFSGCSNITLTNEMATTTGYGLPDQVTGAHVVSSDPCILIVNQPTNDMNITTYTVTATSNAEITEHNFNNTFKSVEAFRIPLTGHQEKQRINFTIQANSCEGSGKKSSVSEFCVSPESSTTNTKCGSANNTKPLNVVGIIVGSSVGVLLLLILIVVAVMTKKRMAESTTVQEPATPQSRVVYSNQTANAQDNEGDCTAPQGMQVYEVVQNPKRV